MVSTHADASASVWTVQLIQEFVDVRNAHGLHQQVGRHVVAHCDHHAAVVPQAEFGFVLHQLEMPRSMRRIAIFQPLAVVEGEDTLGVLSEELCHDGYLAHARRGVAQRGGVFMAFPGEDVMNGEPHASVEVSRDGVHLCGWECHDCVSSLCGGALLMPASECAPASAEYLAVISLLRASARLARIAVWSTVYQRDIVHRSGSFELADFSSLTLLRQWSIMPCKGCARLCGGMPMRSGAGERVSFAARSADRKCGLQAALPQPANHTPKEA